MRTFDAPAHKTHEFNTQLFFDEATNDAMMSKPPYNERGERKRRNSADGLYAAKQADGTMVGSHLHFELSKSGAGETKVAHFAVAMNLS